MSSITRRRFIARSLTGCVSLAVLPRFLGHPVFAADAPSKRIHFAQIGCGRMGRGDMAGVMRHPMARLVAVCDLDSKRLEDAREAGVEFYRKRGETAVDIKAYRDFREVLARPDIDAVVISTPDHWHALCAVEAAIAGKHVYLQKPVTYSIAEAVALRRAVLARKIILQTGSQQRSWSPFRKASEAVRNGRIGKLNTVRIGIGIDRKSGRPPAEMPVPGNLDYDRWLGPAPEQPYMEGRVHPQKGLGRPGWITTEDFGLGMITNWGAHHIDIAQWAMAQELGGPSLITAKTTFMKDDLWTVHEKYRIEMSYPDDVTVILDDTFENGLRFEGSEGWVFCQRGAERVTASDPNLADTPPGKGPLRSSSAKILSPLGPDAVVWRKSSDHYRDWIDSILAGTEPIAPITQSSRTQEACSAAWIAMKLGRPVRWSAATESFGDDAAANALCDRKARKPEYDLHAVMKKAGIA